MTNHNALPYQNKVQTIQEQKNIKKIPDRFFPNNSERQTFSDVKAEAGIYRNAKNQICAIAYSGRKCKPDFKYRFTSTDEALKYINNWIMELEQHQAYISKRREEHKKALGVIQVGDIFYSSWGYDQTNIDFFQVIEVVGKKTVKLREINGLIFNQHEYASYGFIKPLPNEFINDSIIKKRISPYGDIRIDDVRRANKFTEGEKGLYTSWDGH